MLNIFLNKNSDTNYPITHFSKFDNIKRRYLEQLKQVKEYYYNKEEAVNNRHLLNRIINTLLPDIEHNDIIDYLRIVSANARLVSKQFDISSNIHFGKILTDVFYGNGSKELFLYTESSIDIDDVETNWRDYASVRVIYNENTNLAIPLPSYDEYLPGTLVVMEIDIILMMLQYRGWYLERISLDLSTNINIFIKQIIYTNMVDNILDLAIMNRLNLLNMHLDIEKSINRHPFLVMGYDEKMNDILKTVMKNIKNKSMAIEQVLLTIPAIVSDNMLEVLYISHRFYTMQSKWVLWVSRVPYMEMILDIIGDKGIRRNRDTLNRLPVLLKRLERDSTLARIMDEIVYFNFMIDVNEILKKIKK